MTQQPRDSNGHFLPMERVNSEEEKVVFDISEFESRVIGNRLHRAAERLEKIHNKTNIRLDQDCRYWARRFLEVCSTREKNDDEYYQNRQKRHTESNYHIRIELTDYECWSIGNRLFEIGQYFEKKEDERVASETKWLARRFHAEQQEAEQP
jgi:hypothetical protein